MKFVSKRKENIVGKGENAGYQHFLLFQQCFQGLLSSGSYTSNWGLCENPKNANESLIIVAYNFPYSWNRIKKMNSKVISPFVCYVYQNRIEQRMQLELGSQLS